MIWYNDHDAFACAWLRNLIEAGGLPRGEVDERSVLDVRSRDLRPYRQCHFFAGIGGWPYALRLAGCEDIECWTASLPCQPLSVAGQQRGHADERHLWPAFHRLVEECRPAIIFGEQVASKDGREWFAAIRHDLEAIGYVCGAADLPASGVAALHERARIFWVCADSDGNRWQRREQGCGNGEASFRIEEFEGLVSSQIRVSVPSGRFGALVDGVSDRTSKLRAYGNAIVPQVAAQFIRAMMSP